MIVCTNCGFHNDDDDRFCGGCQEYLGWTGATPADTEPGDAGDQEGVETAEHKGLVERVLDHFGGVDGEGDPATSTPDGGAAGADRGRPAPDIAAMGADTVARVEAEAAEATKRERAARDDVADRRQAAERARREADEAEQARAEAAEEAEVDAARLARLRDEVGAAEGAAAPGAADAEPGADDVAAAPPPAPVLDDDAPVDAADSPPPGAVDLAALRAELESAEAQAGRAEQQARAEEEAAEAARRAAEEAAEAEREAAHRAEQVAEAAERARRAAALVARPAPAAPAVPATEPGRADRPMEDSGPGPARPTPSRRPRRPPPDGSDDDGNDPGQAASGPGAVRPDEARVRRVAPAQRRAPSRKLRPGDLVCGNCGEGNAPDRNFCRRCGDDLAEVEVVRVPWWKRPFVRQPKPPPPAGTRPGKGDGRDLGASARGAKRGVLGAFGRVARIVAIVTIAGAALGVAIVPSWRDAVTDRASGVFTSVRRLVSPEYVPVIPTGVTASSEQGDHPATSTIDNSSNRWWVEDAGPDELARLVVEFAEPVDIAAFGITPGAAEPDAYVAQSRPRRVHLVFSNGTTADLDLVDEHEFQSFRITEANQVTSVEIQVTEEWPGQSDSDDVAITGVEFRTVR